MQILLNYFTLFSKFVNIFFKIFIDINTARLPISTKNREFQKSGAYRAAYI